MALKDLFVKSDDNQNQSNQPVTAPVGQVQVPTQQSMGNIPQPMYQGNVTLPTGSIEQSVAPAAQADPTIVEKLWNAIIAENRPGPDYLELKNNVEALDGVPLTADQKIISAFKILNKNYPNFKKDDITTAVQFYIDVVNREKATGLGELNKLRTEQVDSVATKIAEKQQQLAELKQQLADLNDEIAQMNAQMLAADDEIKQKENVFNASVDAVMAVLNNDSAKIQSIQF